MNSRFAPWIVLGAGIALTSVAALEVKKSIEQEAADKFAFTSDQVTLKIHERLEAYALILKGGAGLFAASSSVDRHAWSAYVETLRAQDSVRGVQGIGFSQLVQPDQLADHIAAVREEGFPDYTVRPEGERPVYTSIVYLEPFRDRNLRAFGFDMFSEPVRRAAMERARDTGNPALSGKVELVQETGTEVQAGTLMYVPVYRNGASIDTVAQRRDALIGWSYSPYRMTDLLEGILADWEGRDAQRVGLRIYDGPEVSAGSLLYAGGPAISTDSNPIFYQQRTIDFNGQTWVLTFGNVPGMVSIQYGSVWATLLGGIALSTLLCWLMISLARTQIRANEIAETLTVELRQTAASLRESELRWKFAVEGSGDGIWDWDVPQGKVFFNLRWKEMLGYSDNDIGNEFDEWHKRIHPDDLTRVTADVTAHLDGRTSVYANEHRIQCKDSTWMWILARGLVVQRDSAGQALRMVGTHTDISERKSYQDQLEHSAQFDHLTGLPNRVLLADRLHQAVIQVQRQKTMLAVAFLDLDGFKVVNDRYGHNAGDYLLRMLSGHMRQALREGDTLARMGGDEFVVVFLDLPDAESSLPMLSRLLSAAAEEVCYEGNALRVSASLGVTYYPQDEELDAEQLLRQADQAMYQAKQSGKNRFHIFDDAYERSVRDHHEASRSAR